MMEDYERILIETEARSKSNMKRLDEVEQRITENEKLTSSVQVLANEMTHVKENVESMSGKLDNLIAEPGKNYKDIKGKIVWAVIAAVLAFLLGYFGL